MWNARLESVPAVIDGTAFYVEVVYHDDDTGRFFTQSVKLSAGNIDSITDVVAVTDTRRAELEALDKVRAILFEHVGKDLDAKLVQVVGDVDAEAGVR